MEVETNSKSSKKSRRLSKKDRKRMSNYFTEYCNATSIHGFRYLGEQKRSCLEKLWWLVTILICVYLCAYLIIQTYYKWDRSPVIVSFATKQTPIWQIPFPAVTICPETKSRQSVFNFTYLYQKEFTDLTEKERLLLEYSALICKPRRTLNNLKLAIVNDTVLNFLHEIAPSFDNTSLKCIWMGKRIECKSVFTPILTDEGICYTFNMLDRSETFNDDMDFFRDYQQHDLRSSGWSLEKGYAVDEKKDTYPRRALFAGAKNGLFITMVTYDMDVDHICGDSVQGYKVLLHHPGEIPRVTEQYFWLPLNQAVIAAIKPDMMTTSEELRNYLPTKRQCFFPEEKILRFFKIYTQQNCEIECLANFTLNHCGCVAFHMPRDSKTPLCGPAKLSCVKEAEIRLLSNDVDYKLMIIEEEANQTDEEPLNSFFGNVKDTITKLKNHHQGIVEDVPEKKTASKGKKSNCQCLQSCTSLRYESETSQSDWNWVEHMRGLNDPYGFLAANVQNGTNKAHMSKLGLFFKDMQFIASERDELYGDVDFLANCGGLLGLFTGFSVISLVEIIYFLSLRLFCNVKNKTKKLLQQG